MTIHLAQKKGLKTVYKILIGKPK